MNSSRVLSREEGSGFDDSKGRKNDDGKGRSLLPTEHPQQVYL